MYSFGSGVLIGTRTDVLNATPVNFGLVQEVTIEESASIKELYGQFQHPIAIARGTVKTCTSSKLTFGTKLEDFVGPEFDFSCFADASGTVMSWSFSEAS